MVTGVQSSRGRGERGCLGEGLFAEEHTEDALDTIFCSSATWL